MADGIAADKERPLAGVVLCFTSISPEQRSQLADYARQMGATHEFDLTSDVTHLLVGEVNTEKYKFVARARSDVVVLLPEWIEAVRQSWMQGGDTDLKALEEKYRVPTFYGLKICVTGFDDMAYRNYLRDTLSANGAEFRKDLTKSVTHLIAKEPRGEKYKYAREWRINVVSVKWFEDSLERGMVLDESRYDPSLPVEKQGVGAWERDVASQKPVKREPSITSANPRARKLRRVTSSKLGDQNEGIWGDIVGGGFTVEQNQATTVPPKEEKPPVAPQMSKLQTARSFVSDTTVTDKRVGSFLLDNDADEEPKGFLYGCRFYVHGFTSKQVAVLRDHLEVNGAQVSDSNQATISGLGAGRNFLIVPHKLPRSEIPSIGREEEYETVTDMWLERCLDQKRLVPPEAHVTSTPFPSFPIPGFDKMRICSTGFAGIDLLHLSKLVKVMGATYEEYLTPSASVLVCNDVRTANAEKLRHTAEWGVPAVSADWLWISVQTGQKKPFEPYLIHTKQSQSGRIEERSSLRPHAEAKDRESFSRRASISPQKHSSMLPPPSDRSATASPHKSVDGDKEKKDKPDEAARKKPPSRSSSRVLESAISSFLKQARESNSNNQNNTTGESPTKNNPNGPQHKRSILNRALSGASTTSTMTNLTTTGAGIRRGAFSRTSSIDTLNEDGYGSAIDENTSMSHQQEPSAKTSRNNSFLSTTGKSTTGVAGGGYIDSPVVEDEEPPPMTQLNYEDPESMRMREKIMQRAAMKARNNAAADQQQEEERQQNQPQQQQQPTTTTTTATKQAVITDDVDIGGHRRTTRRSRRFAEKEKEKEKDREGKRMPFWDDDSE